MFTRLARFTVRRRKAVLAGSVVFFLAAAVIGGGVASKLILGGFEDPNAESSRAADFLEDTFGTSEPNIVLVVRASADGATVDDPDVAAEGRAITDDLANTEGVSQVVSYWSLDDAPPLRRSNGDEAGDKAMVLGVIEGDDTQVAEVIKDISPQLTRADDGTVSVGVGGFAEVFREVNEQVESDLVKAELIAFPLTLLLLVIVFGGLVAAGLPLAVGFMAIIGTFLILSIVASFTDVSIFSLNLTTMLGLGLAIDYALFVVSRFREEMRHGLDPHDAVVRTVETAGRTVAFSAVTLAVSLAALVLFPLSFLRSFAYAGVGVALVAAVASTITLPALLAVLGHKVDSIVIFHRTERAEGEGFWHRAATFVMKRPWPITIGVVAFLFLLGAPFFRIELGLPDDRVLPESATSRQVQDEIRADFTSQEAGAMQIALPGTDPEARAGDIDAYALRLAALPGVSRVDAATGIYTPDGVLLPGDNPSVGAVTARFAGDGDTWVSVVPSVEPLSAEGEALTKAVRDVEQPFDEVLVGGRSAELVDSKASLLATIPWAAAWIALTTFVLLFLMFGSVLVPIKAIIINVLSLSATFGALVWIFQDGRFAGLLDFTATGTITATVPILMFCIAFGLSMDYEVFLLSRIKEEYDRTGDNTASVALGLERTGRIVTAAAVLISVVFLAFATSGVFFIKVFGVGLALAVLMDAFVIRATLVPAFMRLAGRANWWAPAWMRRIYQRFGIHEHVPEPVEVPAGTVDDADELDREPVGV